MRGADVTDNNPLAHDGWASPHGAPQDWASPQQSSGIGLAVPASYPPPPHVDAATDAYARYKPGIIVLRPLGFGQLLDGGIKALRHNPKVMIGLNGAVALVATVAMFGLGYQYFSSILSFDVVAQEQAFSAGSVVGLLAGSLVATLLLTMVTVISSVSVGRSVIGEVIPPGEAWTRSLRRMPTVLVITLLMMLAIIVGYGVVVGVIIVSALVDPVLAVIVGIVTVLGSVALVVWLGIKLSIALPAAALERLGPIASIRRSWGLTTGRFWRILSVLLVATIITSVIQNVLSTPVSVILPLAFLNSAAPPTGLFILLLAVASYVGLLLSTVYVASVTAVIYTDQRMRREGFDLVLAQAAVRPGA
jgi:MFS family permease